MDTMLQNRAVINLSVAVQAITGGQSPLATQMGRGWYARERPPALANRLYRFVRSGSALVTC